MFHPFHLLLFVYLLKRTHYEAPEFEIFPTFCYFVCFLYSYTFIALFENTVFQSYSVKTSYRIFDPILCHFKPFHALTTCSSTVHSNNIVLIDPSCVVSKPILLPIVFLWK
jgi:hypothetical protein